MKGESGDALLNRCDHHCFLVSHSFWGADARSRYPCSSEVAAWFLYRVSTGRGSGAYTRLLSSSSGVRGDELRGEFDGVDRLKNKHSTLDVKTQRWLSCFAGWRSAVQVEDGKCGLLIAKAAVSITGHWSRGFRKWLWLETYLCRPRKKDNLRRWW